MECTHCSRAVEDPKYRLCSTCRERVRQDAKKRYDTLAASGLCIRCGKTPEVLGQRRCSKCKEKKRESNLRAKRHQPSGPPKQCTHCSRAVDIPKHNLCSTCRGAARQDANKRYYKEHKEQILQATRERYNTLAAAGLCTICARPVDVPGLRRCSACVPGQQKPGPKVHQRVGRTRPSEEYARMLLWMLKCEAAYVLGGHCVDCGEEDVLVLQFDHIAGDGWRDRSGNSNLRGSTLWRWIMGSPGEARQKIQLLCANCHIHKTARERYTTNASRANALLHWTPHPTPPHPTPLTRLD